MVRNKTVGVVGVAADAMIGVILHHLETLSIPWFLCDLSRTVCNWEISWSEKITRFKCNESLFELEDISGFYARQMAFTRKGVDAAARVSESTTYAESDSAISCFLDNTPALVVNRPSASASNQSKAYQLFLIRRAGFSVPETIITNNPEEAGAFIHRHDHEVIYKSVSSVRSIVQRITDADIPRLNLVRNCPTQFQRWIRGTDIRVHTVGERVFATEIISDATDYRYASQSRSEVRLRPITLQEREEEQCVQLARQLRLSVTGIDLRRTREGELFCFEVNPAPAFVYYEQNTGQPIGEAIARLLRNGK